MIGRLIILCAVAVCVHAADTNQIAAPNNQQKLGPGDKVSYRVIEDQDEPKPLTVTDSGHLDVPYLGLVHVAGKSTQQVAKEVKGLLEKDLYHQATVVIALELVNRTRSTGKVYVTGQVRNKGGFDISGPDAMTVSKAILAAGGFSDFSDKKNVRLIRKGADGTTQTFVVNVVEIWEKGKLEKDLVVQPDDMVVVPARLVNY
jgi:protein involved in polysaccharide export with SLBB domain